jgi:multiple sugar transport system substrate-binding protein
MMDQLAAALAGGNPPDLARLKEYRLADLGARGALLPLDALVATDPAIRLADFTPQSVEGSRVRAVPASSVSATPPGAPATDGPLLGLPDSHQLVVLFWNQDLVARAGLDPSRSPAGWDALRHAARAVAGLTEADAPANPSTGAAPDSGGAATRWGFQFYEFSTREQTYCWFMEWVWRAGGEVWADAAGRGNGAPTLPRVTLDTPAAQRALQFQVDLLHADRTAVPAGTAVSELIANVPQGRVGYWMTTANAALTYDRTAPGLRVGVGPLPADQRDAHQLQHNALALFRASRSPDAAYRLLSFRSREDVQARWSAEGAWLPVRPALWQRPPFNRDERWRQIGALVNRAGNRTKPVVPEWDAFTAVLLPPLLAAWRGELAPRQALQEAERAGNAHLAAR